MSYGVGSGVLGPPSTGGANGIHWLLPVPAELRQGPSAGPESPRQGPWGTLRLFTVLWLTFRVGLSVGGERDSPGGLMAPPWALMVPVQALGGLGEPNRGQNREKHGGE